MKDSITKKTYITKNSLETQELARQLAKQLSSSKVLAFYGDLGSGKTTFIQGLALGLGIKNRIISPTFIILRTYEREKLPFYHVDLYRINSSNLPEIGLLEIINSNKSIVAIEWAEKISDLLPKDRIDIFLKNNNNDEREITIIEN